MKTIEELTAEVAIKKLSEHFKTDALGVDVQDEYTFFNIHIPHKGHGGLNTTFKIGHIFSIDQWTGYTSVNLRVANYEIEAL